MYCTNCWCEETKVLDSRTSDEWKTIRRRRECINCHVRFTTYEKRDTFNLLVVKSWNKKEKYDREKLKDSILKATNKRNIPLWKIDSMVNEMETKWANLWEITSKKIWEEVLRHLSQLDDISYIRYASVYNSFTTKQELIDFVTGID